MVSKKLPSLLDLCVPFLDDSSADPSSGTLGDGLFDDVFLSVYNNVKAKEKDQSPSHTSHCNEKCGIKWTTHKERKSQKSSSHRRRSYERNTETKNSNDDKRKRSKSLESTEPYSRDKKKERRGSKKEKPSSKKISAEESTRGQKERRHSKKSSLSNQERECEDDKPRRRRSSRSEVKMDRNLEVSQSKRNSLKPKPLMESNNKVSDCNSMSWSRSPPERSRSSKEVVTTSKTTKSRTKPMHKKVSSLENFINENNNTAKKGERDKQFSSRGSGNDFDRFLSEPGSIHDVDFDDVRSMAESEVSAISKCKIKSKRRSKCQNQVMIKNRELQGSMKHQGLSNDILNSYILGYYIGNDDVEDETENEEIHLIQELKEAKETDKLMSNASSKRLYAFKALGNALGHMKSKQRSCTAKMA